MSYLYINNWDKWQSYRKDRGTPPWIKVQRNLLSNKKWAVLTDSEKGQLVSIWIVAADNGGKIPSCPTVIRKICQLDELPNISKFKDLGLLTSAIHQDDANVTPQRQPLDAPEAEAEAYSKEAETEAEREPLSIFKNKILNEEMKKFAEDKGVFGKQLETSWQRFLIKKGSAMIERNCSYEQFFADWQLWILNERIEDAPVNEEAVLVGEDLKIQHLGSAAWRRKRDMTLNPDQKRLLDEYEADNGDVWWASLREFKQGKK